MKPKRFLPRWTVVAGVLCSMSLAFSGVAAGAISAPADGIITGRSPYRVVKIRALEITDIQADGDHGGSTGWSCGEFGFQYLFTRGPETARVHGPEGALNWIWTNPPKAVGVTDPIGVCDGDGTVLLYPSRDWSDRVFPDPEVQGDDDTAWLLDGPINVSDGPIDLKLLTYEDDYTAWVNPPPELNKIITHVGEVNQPTIEIDEPGAWTEVVHVKGSPNGSEIDFKLLLDISVEIPS